MPVLRERTIDVIPQNDRIEVDRCCKANYVYRLKKEIPHNWTANQLIKTHALRRKRTRPACMSQMEVTVFLVVSEVESHPIRIEFSESDASTFAARCERLSPNCKFAVVPGKAVIEYSEENECSPSASTS